MKFGPACLKFPSPYFRIRKRIRRFKSKIFCQKLGEAFKRIQGEGPIPIEYSLVENRKFFLPTKRVLLPNVPSFFAQGYPFSNSSTFYFIRILTVIFWISSSIIAEAHGDFSRSTCFAGFSVMRCAEE